MTDPYDLLCDQAILNGERISPLFRVFWSPEGWRVCGTDLAGDPVFTHEIHGEDVGAAYAQAFALNLAYGGNAMGAFVDRIMHFLEKSDAPIETQN